MTRPDISHANSRRGSTVAPPLLAPLECNNANSGLRMADLKGIWDTGLIFSRTGDRVPTAFADTSLSIDRGYRKSASEGLVTCRGEAIGWYSRKQPHVATSSTEDEYVVA